MTAAIKARPPPGPVVHQVSGPAHSLISLRDETDAPLGKLPGRYGVPGLASGRTPAKGTGARTEPESRSSQRLSPALAVCPVRPTWRPPPPVPSRPRSSRPRRGWLGRGPPQTGNNERLADSMRCGLGALVATNPAGLVGGRALSASPSSRRAVPGESSPARRWCRRMAPKLPRMEFVHDPLLSGEPFHPAVGPARSGPQILLRHASSCHPCPGALVRRQPGF